MTPVALSAIISASGFVLSIGSAAFIAGFRWGQVRSDISSIKATQANMATKEELGTVKEQLAEIKGMFRLTLRDGSP